MNKLKTLKELPKYDLDGGYPDDPSCYMEECEDGEYIKVEELRQEAIKYINEGYEQIMEGFPNAETIISLMGQIRLFKHFFNLTEEDLKGDGK